VIGGEKEKKRKKKKPTMILLYYGLYNISYCILTNLTPPLSHGYVLESS
jgi:hypothetical protein